MLQSTPQAYLVGAGVWSITAELATIVMFHICS